MPISDAHRGNRGYYLHWLLSSHNSWTLPEYQDVVFLLILCQTNQHNHASSVTIDIVLILCSYEILADQRNVYVFLHEEIWCKVIQTTPSISMWLFCCCFFCTSFSNQFFSGCTELIFVPISHIYFFVFPPFHWWNIIPLSLTVVENIDNTVIIM